MVASTASVLRQLRQKNTTRQASRSVFAPAAAATATEDTDFGVDGREFDRRGVARRWGPPRWLLVSVPGMTGEIHATKRYCVRGGAAYELLQEILRRRALQQREWRGKRLEENIRENRVVSWGVIPWR